MLDTNNIHLGKKVDIQNQNHGVFFASIMNKIGYEGVTFSFIRKYTSYVGTIITNKGFKNMFQLKLEKKNTELIY